jgi:hypothetical protein
MSDKPIAEVTLRARIECTPQVGQIIIPDIGPEGEILSTGVLVTPDLLKDLDSDFHMVYGPSGWMGKMKPGVRVVQIEGD